MRNSVFLKLLAALLCVCLAATVIATVAKKHSKSGGDSEVNTPTETNPVTEPVPTDTDDSSIVIDETKTLVATQDTSNSSIQISTNVSTNGVRYAFVVTGLKASTNYRLSWSISDEIDTDSYGIYLMYQTPGMDYPNLLTGTEMYDNSWNFTTNSEAEQYLYFYVAQGFYDSSTDLNAVAQSVKQCVIFNLYELT